MNKTPIPVYYTDNNERYITFQVTSVNDFLHHRKVVVGFFQFSSCNPNLPVGWNVLASFVQDLQRHEVSEEYRVALKTAKCAALH